MPAIYPATISPLLYEEYRATVARSGDVAVCRPVSWLGRTIARITCKGVPKQWRASHAALVGWLNPARRYDLRGSELLLGESIEGKGKQLVPLRKDVCKYPGCYDIYRPRADHYRLFDGETAFVLMARAADSAYGTMDLPRVLFRRHLRWPFNTIPAVANSLDPDARRDCSAQVQFAMRYSWGPVMAENDCDVEPIDWRDPKRMTYLGTLFYTPAQIAEFRKTQPAAAESIEPPATPHFSTSRKDAFP